MNPVFATHFLDALVQDLGVPKRGNLRGETSQTLGFGPCPPVRPTLRGKHGGRGSAKVGIPLVLRVLKGDWDKGSFRGVQETK